MSQVLTRKLIEAQTEYAGRKWWYEYRSLPRRFEEASVKQFAGSVLERASLLTKQWSDELNSEWLTRIFFATKMVLGASVMAESLEYALRQSLRPVVPYLEYYTVLYALRAVVITDPGVSWNDAELLSMTHQKTINIAADIVKRIDPSVSAQLKQEVLALKDFRELISYRAPSSGDKFNRQTTDVLETSRLLLEIAQLQSELLEVSLQKKILSGT